jgi:arylsulfatase A-like enzyme
LAKYLDDIDDISLPSTTTDDLEEKPIFQQHPPSAERFPYDEMTERDHRLVRAAYFAMVDLIDDQIGEILDTLESMDQTRDTVIIFMSDHGEMLGDHGIYLKGPYFYEPAIRVPLIFSSTERFSDGVDIDSPVELVDIAPTILDLADIDVPSHMHGTSLRPVLDGERSDPVDKTIYCEYYHALEREQFYGKLQQEEYWGQENSLNTRFAETFADADIYPPFHQDDGSMDELVLPYSTMVCDENYKLIKHHSISTGELYDLEDDPEEIDNKWHDESYAAVKSDLLNEMTDSMAMTIDPGPDRYGRF